MVVGDKCGSGGGDGGVGVVVGDKCGSGGGDGGVGVVVGDKCGVVVVVMVFELVVMWWRW